MKRIPQKEGMTSGAFDNRIPKAVKMTPNKRSTNSNDTTGLVGALPSIQRQKNKNNI